MFEASFTPEGDFKKHTRYDLTTGKIREEMENFYDNSGHMFTKNYQTSRGKYNIKVSPFDSINKSVVHHYYEKDSLIYDSKIIYKDSIKYAGIYQTNSNNDTTTIVEYKYNPKGKNIEIFQSDSERKIKKWIYKKYNKKVSNYVMSI